MGWGNTRDAFPDFMQGGTITVDLGGSLKPDNGVFQEDVFADQAGAFASAAGSRANHFRLEGLGKKIECTLAHRLNSKLNARNRGEKDDGQCRIDLVRRTEN